MSRRTKCILFLIVFYHDNIESWFSSLTLEVIHIYLKILLMKVVDGYKILVLGLLNTYSILLFCFHGFQNIGFFPKSQFKEIYSRDHKKLQ